MTSAEKRQIHPSGDDRQSSTRSGYRMSPSTRSSDLNLAMTPSPPPNKPSTRRPRSVRSRRINSASSTQSEGRPTSSSLSKYNILPPIEDSKHSVTNEDGDTLIESTRRLSISKKPAPTSGAVSDTKDSIRIPTGVEDEGCGNDNTAVVTGNKRKNSSVDYVSHKSFRTLSLSEEPSEPPRLLLKIKVPNGKELTRYFRPSETFQVVMDFAESNMGDDLSGYTLVKTAPSEEYSNMSMTLEKAGIQDRTLLLLQTPAPE